MSVNIDKICWYKFDCPIINNLGPSYFIRIHNFFKENKGKIKGISEQFTGHFSHKDVLFENGFIELKELHKEHPWIESYLRFLTTGPFISKLGYPKNKYDPHIDSKTNGIINQVALIYPIENADDQSLTTWHRIIEGKMFMKLDTKCYEFESDSKLEKIDELRMQTGQPYIIKVSTLHGIVNNSEKTRVTCGWHFEPWLTWCDVISRYQDKLSR